MGYSKDQWIEAVERAEDQFCMGKIDEEEFRAIMKGDLGFLKNEIDEAVARLLPDRENVP